MFIVTPAHNRPKSAVMHSGSERMNIDLHFGNSQEH
jgi:hypothetical protein